MPRSFSKKVYDIVSRIPRGTVMGYRDVAYRAGDPRGARAVGNAMNKNPDLHHVPCHRVIRVDGMVGGYVHGTAQKIKKLRAEGVRIRNGKVVDMTRK